MKEQQCQETTAMKGQQCQETTAMKGQQCQEITARTGSGHLQYIKYFTNLKISAYRRKFFFREPFLLCQIFIFTAETVFINNFFGP